MAIRTLDPNSQILGAAIIPDVTAPVDVEPAVAASGFSQADPSAVVADLNTGPRGAEGLLAPTPQALNSDTPSFDRATARRRFFEEINGSLRGFEVIKASPDIMDINEIRDALGNRISGFGHLTGRGFLFLVDNMPTANLPHEHTYVFVFENGRVAETKHAWPASDTMGLQPTFKPLAVALRELWVAPRKNVLEADWLSQGEITKIIDLATLKGRLLHLRHFEDMYEVFPSLQAVAAGADLRLENYLFYLSRPFCERVQLSLEDFAKKGPYFIEYMFDLTGRLTHISVMFTDQTRLMCHRIAPSQILDYDPAKKIRRLIPEIDESLDNFIRRMTAQQQASFGNTIVATYNGIDLVAEEGTTAHYLRYFYDKQMGHIGG